MRGDYETTGFEYFVKKVQGLNLPQISSTGLNICGAVKCGVVSCGAQACGANACGINECGADVAGGGACTIDICPLDGCIIDLFVATAAGEQKPGLAPANVKYLDQAVHGSTVALFERLQTADVDIHIDHACGPAVRDGDLEALSREEIDSLFEVIERVATIAKTLAPKTENCEDK